MAELRKKQRSSGKQSQGGKTMLTLLKEERARSAKLAEALTVAIDYLKEVADWMNPENNPVWHPDHWSASQAAQEAIKKLKAYEASLG